MAQEYLHFIDLIRLLTPFITLTPEQRDELLQDSHVRHFKKKEFVFRQGDRDEFQFYLLEGELELSSDGHVVTRVAANTEGASRPLSQLQPRQMSALATTAATILCVDRAQLEQIQIQPAFETCHGMALEVTEMDTACNVDWMTRLLQSNLFARIPISNVHRIFARMESLEIPAGKTVCQEGDLPSHYYVIVDGQCQVTRIEGSAGVRLAELGAGECFGGTAIISGHRHKYSVATQGTVSVIRLAKSDFVELIKTPLVQSVDLPAAAVAIKHGALCIDLRGEADRDRHPVAEAMTVVCEDLRLATAALDRDKRYLILAGNEGEGAEACFILAEYGIDSAYLVYQGGDLPQVPTETRLATGADPLTLTQTGVFPRPKPDYTRDAEAQEALLNARYAAATVEVKQAERAKEEAELAQLRAEEAPSGGRLAERERQVSEELARANALFAQAQAMVAEVEAAKRAAALESEHILQAAETRAREVDESIKQRVRSEREQREAARAQQAQQAAAILRLKRRAEAQLQAEKDRLAEQAAAAAARLAEAERIKQEAEAVRVRTAQAAEETVGAERARLQAEVTRASNLLAEAETAKHHAEAAKRRAEQEVEAARQGEQARLEQLKAELERQMAERQQALESAYSVQSEELTRLQRLREESELQMQEERERLAREAQAAERHRAEAQRIQQEAEAARLRAERAAQETVESERERLQADVARATAMLAEAEAMRKRVEEAKRVAHQEAQQARQEGQQRIEQLKAEIEKRIAEKEQLLAAAYATQSAELQRVQKMREKTEAELGAERKRLALEAMQAKQEVEQQRLQALEEVERRYHAQREQERQLREDLEHRLQGERAKLDAERARAARHIDLAKRERKAAEQARQAITEEARRKIAEYREYYERLWESEKEKLQAQREHIETEARRIAQGLDEVRRIKEQAELSRLSAQEETMRLTVRRQQALLAGTDIDHDAYDTRIRALQEQASQAGEQLDAAARAEDLAVAAQRLNESELAKQSDAEVQVRTRIEAEVAQWRREQEAFFSSPEQQALSNRQQDAMERVKRNAVSRRMSEVAHNDRLQKEMQNLIKGLGKVRRATPSGTDNQRPATG
ncbi:MAG: cyclic nucleotide-binding domain-containing protein [Gammaproteobacteria bacterium]